MTSQLIDLGLQFSGPVSTNIAPEGCTIHYSGPSPWGSSADRSTAERFIRTTNHDRCPTIWRGYHDYHKNGPLQAVGIAYTSGVCPHGVRYEGRGPGRRTGANGTNYANLVSYATCYIGGDDDPLTDLAKVAYLDEAERLGHPFRWKHKDWFNTSCAGPACDAWQLQGFPPPVGPVEPPPRRNSKMISHVQAHTGALVTFVARPQDGQIVHRWQDPAVPGGWSGWHLLNGTGPKPADFDSVAAVRNSDGRLEVTAWHSGFPGGWFRTWQTKPGENWVPWVRESL